MHKNKKVISLQNYFYVDNILFILFGIRIFYAQSFSIYFVPHLTLFGQICAKKFHKISPYIMAKLKHKKKGAMTI